MPPWCADHCWITGRSEDQAYAAIQPSWGFLDITSFFTSIDQHRLFWLLRSQPELRAELRRFFRRLGCYEGIPEGCSFSPTLANLYLAAIDRRWAGNSVRYGDNIACSDPRRYAAELLTISLLATSRPNFTNRVAKGGPSSLVSDRKESGCQFLFHLPMPPYLLGPSTLVPRHRREPLVAHLAISWANESLRATISPVGGNRPPAHLEIPPQS